MQKSCRQCATGFEISDEDLGFYDKISPVFNRTKYPIVPPAFCPDCRLQRRMSWYNERMLYNQTCNQCKKPVISTFSADKTVPIYCNTCWWGDAWNPLDYSQKYDFNRPFFEQFNELLKTTPQLAIMNDDGVNSENCQYCQNFASGKNCYCVTGSWHTQDSFYSRGVDYSSNIGDSSAVAKSQLCYECIDSIGLYNCSFLQNSENCSDCTFGFDLKGCKNCFGCFGLRQKEFHIFNQPHTKEEYHKKIAALDLSSCKKLQKARQEYQQWILQFPRKNMEIKNSENSEGNNLFDCKNTLGFSSYNMENCRYHDRSDHAIFSQDIFNSGSNQWCYEGFSADNSYMAFFTLFCWKNKNIFYSNNCHSCEYIFGCIGLRQKKYCIFNQQYTQQEYETLVPKIIEHMQKTSEWSEFFPTQISTFAYNETVAQEYFPLTKKEALAKGWQWKDRDPKEYQPQSCHIPEDIIDVPDTIIQEILACAVCGKNYKIVPQELSFYRKMNLPVPTKCPDCRNFERFQLQTPYKLWLRNCHQCKKSIKTPYAPHRQEIIYCEDCYQLTH